MYKRGPFKKAKARIIKIIANVKAITKLAGLKIKVGISMTQQRRHKIARAKLINAFP